jgi:hypothetical protein
VAIYYGDATAFNMSNVSANGGTGGISGQNGTVFWQQQTTTALTVAQTDACADLFW